MSEIPWKAPLKTLADLQRSRSSSSFGVLCRDVDIENKGLMCRFSCHSNPLITPGLQASKVMHSTLMLRVHELPAYYRFFGENEGESLYRMFKEELLPTVLKLCQNIQVRIHLNLLTMSALP